MADKHWVDGHWPDGHWPAGHWPALQLDFSLQGVSAVAEALAGTGGLTVVGGPVSLAGVSAVADAAAQVGAISFGSTPVNLAGDSAAAIALANAGFVGELGGQAFFVQGWLTMWPDNRVRFTTKKSL